jgi:hypothetical protein
LELIDEESAYIERSSFDTSGKIKLYAEFRKVKGNLKIGAEYYDSLAEAFAAAKNEDVITIVTSFTEPTPAEIPAGKTVTLKTEDISVKNIHGSITVRGGLKLKAGIGSLIISGAIDVKNGGVIEIAGKLFADKISLAAGIHITVSEEISLPSGCLPIDVSVSGLAVGGEVLKGTGYDLVEDDCDKFSVNGSYMVKLYHNSGVIAVAVVRRSASGKMYATIKDAVADSVDGSVNKPDKIVVLKDISIDEAVAINSGKHIKLVPYNGRGIIKRSDTFGDSLFTVSSGASLALAGDGNKELVIDGGKTDSIPTTNSLVMVSGGTLTLNDNAILQNNSNLTGIGGGGVHITGGAFNMNGGLISENTTSNGGGGVHITGGAFNMNGGLISGNTTSNGGGGVYVAGGAFNMNGGLISENTTSDGGGGVYVAGGTFTMSGSAVVAQNNDVYLTRESVINVAGPLTGAVPVAKIKPQNEAIGTLILSGVDLNTINRFKLSLTTRSIRFESDKGWLYFVCLSTDGVEYDTLQAAISAAGGSLDSPDTIDLLADIDITSAGGTISLASGKHIQLVPRGGTRTIKRVENGSGSLFTVSSGASLALAGDGINELVIDGGKTDSKTTTNSLVTVSGGTLTLDDGAVLQNNSNPTGNGGGVYVDDGAFTMNGGKISNNSSNDGGGVHIDTGTFNMTGGVIEGNEGGANGGGVYLRETSSIFNFSGGVIQNNRSTDYSFGGGGVTAVHGRLVMSGTAEIKKNHTTGKGGGVFLETGDASFEISGNAKVYGSDNNGNKNTANRGQALYSVGTVRINGAIMADMEEDNTIPPLSGGS